MRFASLARSAGGSPFGIDGSSLLALFNRLNVASVTGVTESVGAQKLFFCAFCLSLAALLKQPALPQRKSIRCGWLVKGLSCSGRGLLQVLNFNFWPKVDWASETIAATSSR